MKICPYCAAENNDESEFCESCHQNLSIPTINTQFKDPNFINKQRNITFIVIGCVLVLFITVCFVLVRIVLNGKTAFSNLIPIVPTATSTIIPSPTIQKQIPNQYFKSANLIISDDFSKNSNNWAEVDNDLGSISISDGFYRFTKYKSDKFLWVIWPRVTLNGVIKIDFKFNSSTSDICNAMIFWRTNDNNDSYAILLDNRQEYSLWKFEQNQWISIKDTNHSDLIRNQSEWNTIVIVYVRNTTDIFLNGSYLTSLDDASIKGGGFAFGVDADKNTTAIVDFDNVSVYYIPDL